MKTRRDHLVKWLVVELGSRDNVKEFSSSLKQLGICDLTVDEDLKAITEHGLIDTMVTLYKFGTMSKLIEVKTKIAMQRNNNG